MTNIGHGRPEIAEVAAASVAEVDYVVPPWGTPARVALRDRLVQNWLPAGLTRVGFCSGGSEAADSAIRLAIAHHVCSGRPERRRIIGRWPSYHGVTVASLSAGGHLGRRRGYDGVLLDFPHVAWDDPEALEAMIIAQGPATIAAFIAEPIIGAAGGVLYPPDGYFAEVAEICRRYGVLLIVDEVMSGFGRAGRNFAIDHWGVTPDIMYGGKGLGGGYAAVAGVFAVRGGRGPPGRGRPHVHVLHVRRPVHALRGGRAGAARHGGREPGRALGQARDRAQVPPRRGARRPSPCLRGARRAGAVGRRRAGGAPRAPHLVPGHAPGSPPRCRPQAMSRDVWIYPSGSGDPVQDAMMIGPPFTITEEEIDRIVATLRDSIDAAAAAQLA